MESAKLTRTPKLSKSTRKTEWRRNEFAYGKWTTADGTVLLNRRYMPIFEGPAGGAWVQTDRTAWISWVDEVWFYDDEHTERRAIELSAEAMKELGSNADASRSARR